MHSGKKPSPMIPLASSSALSRRTLLLGFIAIVVGMLANAFVLIHSINDVRAHQSNVSHTADVLQELEVVMSSMKDSETGQRGYSMSGDDTFLSSFESGRKGVAQHLDQLRFLVESDGQQLTRVESLALLVNKSLEYHNEAIAVRRDQGLEAAVQLMQTRKGKSLMDDVRAVATIIGQTERRRLASQTAAAEESSRRVDWTFVIASAASFCLAFAAYYFMRGNLRRQETERAQLATEAWISAGQFELGELIRSKRSLEGLGDEALGFFARYIGAFVGTLYIVDRGDLLLISSFGTAEGSHRPKRLDPGQGMVGEALKQGRMLGIKDVPAGYLQVSSSLGGVDPQEILVVPLIYDGVISGVMELASIAPFQDLQKRFVEEAQRTLAITITSAVARKVQQELLEETQRQAEELQSQQEELRASNAELESQTESLRETQQHLQVQQEELRQSNEELEQQTRALDAQKDALSAHNADLVETKRALEIKAQELEQASQYKSEFLSNMSHELRTPLNSLLLLATLIAEDRDKRLTDQQIEWAKTIYKSGNDLLALISDILDLSKVEAGKIELEPQTVAVADIVESLDRSFRHMAEHKGLQFKTSIEPGTPETLKTDRLRLDQVLKNLLSNAIKFTAKGDVSIQVTASEDDLVFSVIDTGIGISEDKLNVVFEAFQQADSTTSRSYGGTGLGLTISRELAKLLDGDVEVESTPDKGSIFRLRVPKEMKPAEDPATPQKRQSRTHLSFNTPAATVPQAIHKGSGGDDITGDIEGASDRRVLIVEDDLSFGKALATLARESGFKAVLATTGRAALSYAEHNQIAAVLLDMQLPDLSGLVILEQLKRSPATRHVPVHVVSGLDVSHNALSFGAMGYLTKPASKESLLAMFKKLDTVLEKHMRRVLVIEDDKMQREAIRDLLGDGDLTVEEASTGKAALEKLASTDYDCVVLDLRLPDMNGFELLEKMNTSTGRAKVPVVVYTGKDLAKDEQERLERYAESIVIKGARSPQRLLDEVTLFLHRVEGHLPPDSQVLLRRLRIDESGLEGTQVMVVDDDMRNVYALVAALESAGIKVLVAKNGAEALEKLKSGPTPDLVLMDIMMPVMDGYETMRRIREDLRFKRLPMIALTAKAMRGDIKMCLEAGANDYLAKPVQLDQLLSLIRVWLPRRV